MRCVSMKNVLLQKQYMGLPWSGPALLLDRGGDSKVFILCHILNRTEEFYGFREFDGLQDKQWEVILATSKYPSQRVCFNK